MDRHQPCFANLTFGLISIMFRGRKLILAALAVLIIALVVIGRPISRSYAASGMAADQFMASALDGPWVRVQGRFVLDFDPNGYLGKFAPHWVFRYRNPKTGEKSKRIYVTVPDHTVFHYNDVLDPMPLLGFRP